MKNFRIYFVFIILLLALSGCGSHNPNASSGSTSINQPMVTSPTVTAYTAVSHQYMLTGTAINLLIAKANLGSNPTLTKILTNPACLAAIEQGAKDEDNATANKDFDHYWDPIHNEPLTDGPLLTAPISFNTTSIIPIQYEYENITTAKKRSKKLFTEAKTEFDAYYKAKSGNIDPNDPQLHIILKKLGAALHIMQEMSSPPHVRNDLFDQELPDIKIKPLPPLPNLPTPLPARLLLLVVGNVHIGKSGYEETIAYGKYTIPPLDTLPIVDIQNDAALWGEFDKLALLTNQNFFSEDTIPHYFPAWTPPFWRLFEYPHIPVGNGYMSGGKDIVVNHLAYVIESPFSPTPLVWLDDTVQQDYADILVPKAISYTAGAIQYFLSQPAQPGGVVLYITDGMTNRVLLVETGSKSINIKASINLPDYPTYLLPNHKNKMLYALAPNIYGTSSIHFIDTKTNTLVRSINTGYETYAIDINENTGKLYALNTQHTFDYNTYTHIWYREIEVIDATTGVEITRIPVTQANRGGVYSPEQFKHAMAINTVTNIAYILWSSDQDYISMVDLASTAEIPDIIPVNVNSGRAWNIGIDPIHNMAYVSADATITAINLASTSNQIQIPGSALDMILDSPANKLIVTDQSLSIYSLPLTGNNMHISTSPLTPLWIALDPSSHMIYGHNSGSMHNLFVIDGTSGTYEEFSAYNIFITGISPVP